jgi:hypothetical protein
MVIDMKNFAPKDRPEAHFVTFDICIVRRLEICLNTPKIFTITDSNFGPDMPQTSLEFVPRTRPEIWPQNIPEINIYFNIHCNGADLY